MAEKKSVIRPLNASETTQFFEDYTDLFLNAMKKQIPGTEETTDETLAEKLKTLSYGHNQIDPSCILELKNRLVRIEYPGEVVRVDRAIETLGGLKNIEMSVADHTRKLELRFHPKNLFNKPAAADKDFKPGILLKVTRKGSSNHSSDESDYEYEAIGVSVVNFTFNRLCDFQYLPLVTDRPETKESKTTNIYKEMLPTKEVPDNEWLCNDKSKNMMEFLIPVKFTQYDSSQVKLFTQKSDKDTSNLVVQSEDSLKLSGMRRDTNLGTASTSSSKAPTSSSSSSATKQNVCRIFGKNLQQVSVFVSFKDPLVPSVPLAGAVAYLTKYPALEDKVERIKQLFEERPIWTKSAIRYNTGISADHLKMALPIVAYHFTNGPWRISWVKLGYDPRQDPKSRIYQTLDYRIRTSECNYKVKAKRSYTTKTFFLGTNFPKKISLKADMSAKPKPELDETCYVLRPGTIPAARQMFYQLCDLILPEIQDMITKLPPGPEGSYCDPKDGFLPRSFIETARNVVNTYVVAAVQKELLEDHKQTEPSGGIKIEQKKAAKDGSLDYCNQMLSNIKRGIYKNVNFSATAGPAPAPSQQQKEEDIEQIELSSDDDDDYGVGQIIQTIPESMDGEEEDEEANSELSDESEVEIDMDAVQEINEIITRSKAN